MLTCRLVGMSKKIFGDWVKGSIRPSGSRVRLLQSVDTYTHTHTKVHCFPSL
jgi:DNA-binding transcriptional regulator YiaG